MDSLSLSLSLVSPAFPNKRPAALRNELRSRARNWTTELQSWPTPSGGGGGGNDPPPPPNGISWRNRFAILKMSISWWTYQLLRASPFMKPLLTLLVLLMRLTESFFFSLTRKQWSEIRLKWTKINIGRHWKCYSVISKQNHQLNR